MITCNLVTFTYIENFQQTRVQRTSRFPDYNNKRVPHSGIARSCVARCEHMHRPFLKAPQMQISMHDKPRCMLRMHVSPTMLYFRIETWTTAFTRARARTNARTHARTHVSVTLAISTARGNTYRPRVNLPRAWAILAEKCRFVICSIIAPNRLHSAYTLRSNTLRIYTPMRGIIIHELLTGLWHKEKIEREK